MFIVHKNENKTSIQPILKTNFTYFMFNKFFCEMKGNYIVDGEALLLIHWGGNGGMVQIAS